MSETIGEEFKDDNVTYIDEFRRERWLLKLRMAREMGEVAVFNRHEPVGRNVIPFPERPEPDGAA